jgi:hypothetical protein
VQGKIRSGSRIRRYGREAGCGSRGEGQILSSGLQVKTEAKKFARIAPKSEQNKREPKVTQRV